MLNLAIFIKNDKIMKLNTLKVIQTNSLSDQILSNMYKDKSKNQVLVLCKKKTSKL